MINVDYFELIFLEGGYGLEHSDTSDMEEDSVDRLWLVIRSLKSPEGKYVLKLIQ